MKTNILAAALILISASALADPYAAVGYGGRPGAYNAYLGEQFTANYAAELDYIDEGIQPHGIPDNNQIISVNGVATMPVYKSLSMYGKIGVADMQQQTGYPWSGFSGFQVGVGVEYPLAYRVSVFTEVNQLHTQQYIKQFENFTDYAFGLRINF